MSHIAYHIRRCIPAEWDAWAVTTDLDGVTAPATEQDLLNRGVIVLHRGSAEVIYHFGRIGEDVDAGYPGSPITPTSGPDVYLERRYARLPEAAKPKVYRARVYRNRDGTSLRAQLETELSAKLEPRVPATGQTSAVPSDPPGAAAILEEARTRAHGDGQTTPSVIERLVPMTEVRSGDVVDSDSIIPVRMAGEPDR
jgi:hypothetical protein